MMTLLTLRWRRHQARASCDRDRPALSAIGPSFWTLVSVSSIQFAAVHEHVLAGIGGAAAFGQRLARLVFAGQDALRQRRKDDLAHALRARTAG